MEKLFKPDTFDTLPNTESSTKHWVHWKARFNKFVSKCSWHEVILGTCYTPRNAQRVLYPDEGIVYQ